MSGTDLDLPSMQDMNTKSETRYYKALYQKNLQKLYCPGLSLILYKWHISFLNNRKAIFPSYHGKLG